jgi:hypothetical protein
VTTIGTRSAILISAMPTIRVCGSSPIDNKEPRTFKTGPRCAGCAHLIRGSRRRGWGGGKRARTLARAGGE